MQSLVSSLKPRKSPAPMPPQNPSITPSTIPLTVLELFQSQGCSSCPTANDNVLKLAHDPNVLVMTYDVTYWDHLGWRDTFGNSVFDRRQWAYARTLGNKNVFTPQVHKPERRVL